MKSYSVQTTIALLGAMTACTAAVPARGSVSRVRKERQLLLDNVDILESNEGGLLVKLWGSDVQSRSGIIMDSINTGEEDKTLADAMESASLQSSKLRGGTLQGSGSLQGTPYGGKGLGKGAVLGYGKACKTDKKDKAGSKGEKAKAGFAGKDKTMKGKFLHKGKGDKFPTGRPTESPTVSPTVAEAPSAVPTDSPTEEWCHEDYWPSQPHFRQPTTPPTGTPTITPMPTTSSAPSASPTMSNAPTVSSAPTVSAAPSPSPSVSPKPTITATPTTPVVLPGLESKSFCQILNAAYGTDGITIWNPALATGAVKEGTAALRSVIATPIDVGDTQTFSTSVSFKVSDVDVDEAIIEEVLDNAITPPVILEILGCRAEAMAVATEYYSENRIVGRKLEEEEPASTFIAAKNWECVKSSCSEDGCDVTCATEMNYIGSLTFDEFEDVALWSIKEYFTMLDDVTTWYPRQTISEDAIVLEKIGGPSIDGVNELDSDQSAKQGMRAGPFIGAATGLLAVLLLMVLFVRRRRYYGEEEISHLKLDDDADEGTFYNGSDGNSDTPQQYNSRDTHIVGEGDSVISHWTGYTGRKAPSVDNYDMSYNRSGLMKDSSADVHQCSSATCEICHEKRMAGITFVKTGILTAPSASPSIPSDASRDYIAEDTVML